MIPIASFVGMQVYVSKEVAASIGGFGALTSSGTSILVHGLLRETPPGTLQVCCPTLHRCTAAEVGLFKADLESVDTNMNVYPGSVAKISVYSL